MSPRKRTVALDPATESKISELRNQAKVLLAQHAYDNAIEVLDQAIDLNPDSYKLYRLRSIAFACLKDYAQSSDDANKVIELAPTIMDGYYHKGFAEYHQKNYADAAHAFKEGLRINPSDRAMQQGFWDAITLISQNRADATAIINAKEEAMRAEAAAAAAAVRQAELDAQRAIMDEQAAVLNKQQVAAAAVLAAAASAAAAAAAAAAGSRGTTPTTAAAAATTPRSEASPAPPPTPPVDAAPDVDIAAVEADA